MPTTLIIHFNRILGIHNRAGWFIYLMENPINIDDLGYPHFRKPPNDTRKISMTDSPTLID